MVTIPKLKLDYRTITLIQED
jgi:hypothetical protein